MPYLSASAVVIHYEEAISSVCTFTLPLPKSRTEGRSKLKIDRKETHDTGDSDTI